MSKHNAFPTYIKDIDQIILINCIPTKSLSNVIRTNKYLHKISNSDTFWMNKVLHEFQNISIEEHLKCKSDVKSLSWKKYFLFMLCQFKKPDKLNNLLIKNIEDEHYNLALMAFKFKNKIIDENSELHDRVVVLLLKSIAFKNYEKVKFMVENEIVKPITMIIQDDIIANYLYSKGWEDVIFI